MKDEFVNRLAMFQTCLGTLNSPEHKPTWFNQPPLAVTTKVAQAVTAVADLEAFVAQYGADITGAAADNPMQWLNVRSKTEIAWSGLRPTKNSLPV